MSGEKIKIISDICPLYKEYGTCEQCNAELDIDDEPCYWECMAKDIIRNGYRKQGEGEWRIIKIGDGGTTRTCSNCYISQTVNVYRGKVMFKYCPYCGAKMKGV